MTLTHVNPTDRLAAVVTAVLALASAAGRADTPEPFAAPLEEVTVYARRLQPVTRVAATVAVITADDIERTLAADVRQMVRYEPGISVANDPFRRAAVERGARADGRGPCLAPRHEHESGWRPEDHQRTRRRRLVRDEVRDRLDRRARHGRTMLRVAASRHNRGESATIALCPLKRGRYPALPLGRFFQQCASSSSAAVTSRSLR